MAISGFGIFTLIPVLLAGNEISSPISGKLTPELFIKSPHSGTLPFPTVILGTEQGRFFKE